MKSSPYSLEYTSRFYKIILQNLFLILQPKKGLLELSSLDFLWFSFTLVNEIHFVKPQRKQSNRDWFDKHLKINKPLLSGRNRYRCFSFGARIKELDIAAVWFLFGRETCACKITPLAACTWFHTIVAGKTFAGEHLIASQILFVLLDPRVV